MKDLLIVFNIFGNWDNREEQIEDYSKTLDSVFWNLKNIDSKNTRVVVSSVLVDDYVLHSLKERYKGEITIFRYNERYTVQVSFNKTVLNCIELFKEKYKGYFYISAGIVLPLIQDLFPRIIEKLNSNNYGIIHLQVDKDPGYENFPDYLNKSQDYNIPIGKSCNFHIGVIDERILDFYEVPMTDIHGFCSSESGLSYISYALLRNYIVLGNSECFHYESDRDPLEILEPNINGVIGYTKPISGFYTQGAHLLWGRKIEDFLGDEEGIKVGLGYYPGIDGFVDWNGVILKHDASKYHSRDYYALDYRLKFHILKHYFTSKKELDYNNIKYEIYG